MAVIAYSVRDPAGRKMAEAFKSSGFKERDSFHGMPCWERGEVLLIESEQETIGFSTRFETDLLLFASKHSSAAAKPCLTAHFTGNWGPAQHGGRERELCSAHPSALKAAFEFLRANPLEGFPAIMEATHHGPTALPCRVLFVEVGSSEKEWEHEAACETVARACWEACSAPKAEECVLGIGGGHYCSKFSELEKENAFSHVCPKYALGFLDAEMLEQAIQKAGAPVKKAFVDKKGCGAHKARVINLLEEAGLDYEKV
ncbi:hypothetical protein AUJ15_02125 [Candidatus Micrarchaeota archaeon CG1_02_55_41]|nr:MAG: hypothetical protein AUJ15_02125 [Candidatus Micrarchaeota archaeon CG1_02_55_41]